MQENNFRDAFPASPPRAGQVCIGQQITTADGHFLDSESPAPPAYLLLRSLVELSSVCDLELRLLADVARLVEFQPGQYVSYEGDESCSHGFIVSSGRIALLKSSSCGKELIVEVLEPRDILGLLIVLFQEGMPWQLTARSLQKSQVLMVPIRDFHSVLNSHPTLFRELMSHIVRCLHSSYTLSRRLAHDRVNVRIAAAISSLASMADGPKPEESPMTVTFTRQQLADLSGTTAETAIRVTRDMQREGLIDLSHPGQIGIIDLHTLQDLADS
jgi:CRP-like cAMP-binding protein